MTPPLPDPDTLRRFAADLDSLVVPGTRLGVAVSGGPDSLALLLLASAARPGAVEAATVDHRLRRESADEAKQVAEVCRRIGVEHHVLAVDVPRGSSLQAQARHARYRALADWAIERSLPAVATGHHADDQAETLLMRLARGAGLSGLASTRRSRALDKDILVVRPLLDWRRGELADVVERAGLIAIDDPSNRDPRHDRSRFRGVVERSDWAEAERLALSAQWLADADEAIEWALARMVDERLTAEAGGIAIDPSGLPREFQRRLLLTVFDRLGAARPRGPQLDRAMRALAEGGRASLSGMTLSVGGQRWTVKPAPPRR
jgi:tRNA(Ile)-lysidine synthase